MNNAVLILQGPEAVQALREIAATLALAPPEKIMRIKEAATPKPSESGV